MATLTIRQLDDTVYARLKARARSNHRSIEAEARNILDERTTEIASIVEDLEQFHARMIAKHGYLSDSTDLLRQQRDEE
jgi:plasmid stability protein